MEVSDDDVTIEEGCIFVVELFGECVGDVGDVIGGRGGRPPTFLELGLDAPKLCVMDIFDYEIEQKLLSMNTGLYNAIVTDPPYGIRESQSNRSDIELIQRLCEVASRLLLENGRLVFLMLVECTASTVESCQKTLSMKIPKMIEHTGLVVNIVSLERFNSRLWRATVVLTNPAA